MLFCFELALAAAEGYAQLTQCEVRADSLSGDTRVNVSVCFKGTPEDACSQNCSGFYFYAPEKYLQCERQCPETRPFIDENSKCGESPECVAKCPEARPYVEENECSESCDLFVLTSYENCQFVTDPQNFLDT